MKKKDGESVSSERTVVDRLEIMQILSCPKMMLRIDRVGIYDGFAVGEFTIPDEKCEDLDVMTSTPVMRRVELIEMAFQLLRILIIKSPQLTATIPKLVELLRVRAIVNRESLGARFNEAYVRPGDRLTLRTSLAEINVVISDKLRIKSGKMTAKVGNVTIATIAPVILSALG